jgi:HAD superfamily hydrolase (TIGR01509 family)
MNKALFWDNDGVLVDTEQLYFRATQQVLASVGIPLTTEQYVDLFMVQSTGAWHLAEERGIDRLEVERLRNQRDTLYCQWLCEVPLVMPGVSRVIEDLSGRYLMGIVTSSPRAQFDLMHRRTNLLQYFDFVLTGDDYTRFKPHPEPYLRAIQRSGMTAEACLAIEDSQRGLASAKKAGLRCFVVPNALTRNGNFGDADRIVESVTEILTVL